MPFQWPLDKLALINRALDATSNNNAVAADDGSDEWSAASAVYETELAAIIEKHPWCWTRTMVTLQPALNAPTDTQWDTAYNLPADLVHLIYARIDGRACVYTIRKGPDGSPKQLCINSQGGPPPPVPSQVPAPVTIEYVSSDTSDLQNATPLLVKALFELTIAGIYRGFNEDPDRADREEAKGKATLLEAQVRHDQQLSKHSMYNSRLRAARFMRRPWAPVPSGWSGTGSPG